MKILIWLIVSMSFYVTGICQVSKGWICDKNGVCVLELKDMASYKTDASIEPQVKKWAKEKAQNGKVCDVRVWTDGNASHKIYKDLISYKSPVEIRRKKDSKVLVNFQYVNREDDAAVKVNDEVIFVDHDFTIYLIMPEHNCHGLPTSPTQYTYCSLCKKMYKVQEFYNDFTAKRMSIYIGAKCTVSKTGHCNNLVLSDVPECPKLDDCDQITSGGSINK